MMRTASRRSPALIFAVALTMVSPSLWAADEQYSALSLEQLLDVVITSASKRSESIYTAPSVMEVITAEEIRKLGANNLRDLFDRATSLQTIGSNFNPENVVTIRGQGLQHENNHVLMLVNGRPLRESVAQGLVASFLAGFPLDLVESIEIIRGPGSVLYGSSAFSGIINVKTKPVKDLQAAALSVSYGSFNTVRFDGHFSAGSDDASILIGGKYLNSDGWDLSHTDWLGNSETFKTGDEDAGVVVNAHYKGLSVNGFYGRTRQGALQPTGLYPLQTLDHENGLMDVGFEHGVGSNAWKAKYNVTYNYFDMGEISSNDLLGEATLSGPVGKRTQLLFGTTYEDQNGLFEETAFAPQKHVEASKQLFSLYGQADVDVLSWLKLTGGLQLNKPSDLEGQLSPRVGAVGHFKSGWGFKLLYGEAFRTPTFVERNIIAPGVITGNPRLLPEEIGTIDAQVSFHGSKHSLAATYYHSKMTSLIKRVGYPIEFVNSGEIVFDGIEVEGKLLLGDRFTVAGSLTYQTNEDELGLESTTYTPNTMAKLRAMYNVRPGLTIAAADSYFGEPAQVSDFAPRTPQVNPDATDYHLVTLNATLDINELAGKKSGPSWKVELFADNLLDEGIHYPDINSFHVNSYQIHSGRAFYSRLVVGF